MSKYKFLLCVGLFIAVLPYLGFPSFLDTIMFTFGGLSVAVVSVLARREYVKSNKETIVEKQPVYIESNPPRPRRPRQARPKTPMIAPKVDVITHPSPVDTEVP